MFSTNGTESGTRLLSSFEFSMEPSNLLATQQHLYFTLYEAKKANLYRMNTGTGKFTPINYQGQPFDILSGMNEIVLNDARNTFIIRHPQPGLTAIYAVPDEGEEIKLTAGDFWKTQIPGVNMFTDIAGIGGEVFFNGTDVSKDSVKQTVLQSKRLKAGNYELANYYKLYDQGVTLAPSFARLNDSVYTTAVSTQNGVAKQLILFQITSRNTITSVGEIPVSIPVQDKGVFTFKAEVSNGKLFVRYGPAVWQWQPTTKSFTKIFTATGANWLPIAGSYTLQACGDFIVYSIDAGKVRVRNTVTGAEVLLADVTKFWEIAGAFRTTNYVYVSNHNIYFASSDGSAEILKRYDPVTNTYSVISFPERKGYNLQEISAVNYSEGVFLFYCRYRGKKETKYFIWMLKDE